MTNQALSVFLPCLKQMDDHHAAKKLALTLEVHRFISETRDGGFALALWDALKDLPDVVEHVERLREVNLLFSKQSHDGQLNVAVTSTYRRTIVQLAHEVPWVIGQMLDSKPTGGDL